MPKTVQIRNIDDDTYAALQRHAEAAGITVPELLRREALRLAQQPTRPEARRALKEWLDRISGRSNSIDPAETIKALDEIRGPWPGDAGR